jgi:hypothetical protein
VGRRGQRPHRLEFEYLSTVGRCLSALALKMWSSDQTSVFLKADPAIWALTSPLGDGGAHSSVRTLAWSEAGNSGKVPKLGQEEQVSSSQIRGTGDQAPPRTSPKRPF